MRFISKLLVVGGTAACLALPATAAFASTSGNGPGPDNGGKCVKVTTDYQGGNGYQGNNRQHSCGDNGNQGNNWNKGDKGGNNWNKDPRGNQWGNQGNQDRNKGDRNNGWDTCKTPVLYTSDYRTSDNRGNYDSRGNCVPCYPVKVTTWHQPVRHDPTCVRCYTQSIVFDFPKWSSHLTEVSGPVLYNGEKAKYQGQTFYLENVWGNHFQVSATWGGTPVRNTGQSIWDGVAKTVCPKVTIHQPVLNDYRQPVYSGRA